MQVFSCKQEKKQVKSEMNDFEEKKDTLASATNARFFFDMVP